MLSCKEVLYYFIEHTKWSRVHWLVRVVGLLRVFVNKSAIKAGKVSAIFGTQIIY